VRYIALHCIVISPANHHLTETLCNNSLDSHGGNPGSNPGSGTRSSPCKCGGFVMGRGILTPGSLRLKASHGRHGRH
jgi:hypothetical protein